MLKLFGRKSKGKAWMLWGFRKLKVSEAVVNETIQDLGVRLELFNDGWGVAFLTVDHLLNPPHFLMD